MLVHAQVIYYFNEIYRVLKTFFAAAWIKYIINVKTLLNGSLVMLGSFESHNCVEEVVVNSTLYMWWH
jgi:hypothetical protein